MVAPNKQVVHENARHRSTSTTAGGSLLRPQDDAIPGQTNHAWFKAPDGASSLGQCSELCGFLHAKMSQTVKSCRRRVRRARDAHQPRSPRSRSASRSSPPAAPSATARRAGLHRSGARRQLSWSEPKRLEPILANGREDAGGRQGLVAAGGRRDHHLLQEAPSTGRIEWPVTPPPSTPLPPRLAQRQGRALADDGRPQADRDPLHLDAPGLLRRRRDPRAAHARAARDAGRALHHEATPTTSCSRCTGRRWSSSSSCRSWPASATSSCR